MRGHYSNNTSNWDFNQPTTKIIMSCTWVLLIRYIEDYEVLCVCPRENVFFLFFSLILFKLQWQLDIGKKHPTSKQEGLIPFFDLYARVSILTFFGENGSRAKKLNFFNFIHCSSNYIVSKLLIR